MRTTAGKLKFNSRPIFPVTGKEKRMMVGLFILFMVVLTIENHILVALTPSTGKRVFFAYKPSSPVFRTGDYVTFNEKSRLDMFVKKGDLKNIHTLVKQIGCSPGERLTKQKRNWYCNNKYMGTALMADSKGHRLPQFNFAGVVPAGRYFVIGTNPRSFDSKYYGFIHADEIIYKAVPLW